MKKFILIILTFGLISTQSLAKPTPYLTQKLSTQTKELSRLINVIASIKHYYIRPVNNTELFDAAIRGMVHKLDPHSSYLDSEDLADLQMATNGKFEGIGISMQPDHGVLKVITPIDNSPAQKVGIKSGDLIVRINNQLVKDMKMRKAIKLMRGKKGTKVTIYVLRQDEAKPLKFVITRDTINIKSVRGELIDKHYGYIRIAYFNRETKEDLVLAIAKLKKQSHQQLHGLVLDLRNNPGGILQSSVHVADTFINRQNSLHGLVVYTKGYPNNRIQKYFASRYTSALTIPMVVLINAGSASAAEIVAGALQDHKRAIILGEKSFGKGSVQTILPLDRKSALKLTTALYYTPKGKVIQTEGIKPDVVVAALAIPKTSTETVLITPVKEADLQNHIKYTKHTTTTTENNDKLLHNDFQLYAAVNLLKGLSSIQPGNK